ncbi:MAG TPA: hypothetical protein PLA85_06150, partial [Micropepsaceae bacterium]|nr:hypothetical protein [Micropepsaceae bacterium]
MAERTINIAPVAASPLHSRVAEANRGNRWVTINGMAVARATAGQGPERRALATAAGLSDLSATARYRISGAGARDFCARVLARPANHLQVGGAMFNFWCNGQGQVIGFGWLAALGPDDFLLLAHAPHDDWFHDAADGLGAQVQSISADTGALWIEGPKAAELLAAAGLNDIPAPGTVSTHNWRGIEFAALRSRGPRGLALVAPSDDAPVLWDRLLRAGQTLGAIPVGQAALDAARIARGDVCLHADAAMLAGDVNAFSLGIDHLMGAGGGHFNGKRATGRMARKESRLVQLEIDAAVEDPRLVAVELKGEVVGFLTSAMVDGFAPVSLALAHVRADL